MGGGGEEYAASNGESPEGEAESQDERVQQSLGGPGSGLGGIFVSSCTQHGALSTCQGKTTGAGGGGCRSEVVEAPHGCLKPWLV